MEHVSLKKKIKTAFHPHISHLLRAQNVLWAPEGLLNTHPPSEHPRSPSVHSHHSPGPLGHVFFILPCRHFNQDLFVFAMFLQIFLFCSLNPSERPGSGIICLFLNSDCFEFNIMFTVQRSCWFPQDENTSESRARTWRQNLALKLPEIIQGENFPALSLFLPTAMECLLNHWQKI